MRENDELMAPDVRHSAVCQMYNWPDIARRTEIVYTSAMNEEKCLWSERIARLG